MKTYWRNNWKLEISLKSQFNSLQSYLKNGYSPIHICNKQKIFHEASKFYYFSILDCRSFVNFEKRIGATVKQWKIGNYEFSQRTNRKQRRPQKKLLDITLINVISNMFSHLPRGNWQWRHLTTGAF